METRIKIKSVLFDADGVIIYPPYRFVAYLERELQVTTELTSGFFKGVFADCLVGRADLKQAITPFLPDWGWTESVESFLRCWFEEEHVINKRLLQTVNTLREIGVYCGLATNQERYRLEYMRNEMGFSELFDGIFGSAEIGAVKPDRTYYEWVTARIGVIPEQILFWDDSQRNVDAAKVYGWRAERYESLEGFQRLMKTYSFL